MLLLPVFFTSRVARAADLPLARFTLIILQGQEICFGRVVRLHNLEVAKRMSLCFHSGSWWGHIESKFNKRLLEGAYDIIQATWTFKSDKIIGNQMLNRHYP